MAKWSFTAASFTPVAVADAIAFTTPWFELIGGTTTQLNKIMEVYMGGQAGASAPSYMLVSRDVVVEATPTGLATPNSLGPLDPATAALAALPVATINATTPPQRSSSVTSAKMSLAFNAFGGIVRWVAAPGEEFNILGNTQPLGGASLSPFTGGTPGLMGAHFIFEPS